MSSDVLGQLLHALDLVFDASTPAAERQAAERWCSAFGAKATCEAGQALSSDIVQNDPRLYWFFLSCLERHAARQYWLAPDQASKRQLQQVRSPCDERVARREISCENVPVLLPVPVSVLPV
jgi:hypothetical protein